MLRHYLKKFSFSDSEFVNRFLEDLYVDDYTSSCRSVEEEKELYEKSMTILGNDRFHLRKWVTNHKALQDFFDTRKDGSVRKCAVGLRSFLTCEIRESFSFTRIVLEKVCVLFGCSKKDF